MKPRKPIQPRNPFVALARFRKAGTHRKPDKALRREARMAVTKATRRGEDLPDAMGNRAVRKGFSGVMVAGAR